MREALALARRAGESGDVPVGAVVLDADGRVIGRGFNTRQADGDPLAHAEVLAMREAARTLASRRSSDVPEDASVDGAAGVTNPVPPASAARSPWNLADCTLVVTLEPCPMCAGACLQTHVGRIVFGAWDAKLGACGSVWDIPRDPHIGHSPEVIGGVMEDDCAAPLSDFFAARRSATGRI